MFVDKYSLRLAIALFVIVEIFLADLNFPFLFQKLELLGDTGYYKKVKGHCSRVIYFA